MANNYTITLTIGGPGSGKTKDLIDFKNNNLNNCECISYSWILCSRIKGVTMYNLFRIKENIKYLEQFNINYIKSLTYIKYICIDEIFMFNSDMFDLLINCCNYLPNLSAIYLYGDFMQLKAYGDVFYKNFDITKWTIIKKNTLYRSLMCKELNDKILHYYKYGNINLEEFINCKIDKFSDCIPLLINGWIMCVGTNDRKKELYKYIYKYKGFTKLSDDKLYSKYAQINENLRCSGLYNGQIVKLIINENTDETRIIIETEKKELKILFGKFSNYKYNFPIEPMIFSTIHKLQGSTLEDGIIIDLDSLFEFNSFYTAISRVKSLDKIKIFYNKDFSNIKIETNLKLFELLKNLN